LDLSLQEPVRNAVLRQLDDKGKDVSTIAVKCLSTLVKKFNPDQVNAVVDKMGHMIVDTKGSEEGSSKATNLSPNSHTHTHTHTPSTACAGRLR